MARLNKNSAPEVGAGNLKNKFTEAGFKSNEDGTKFTKGNKVYKLNKDGTFDFINKDARKQNIKNITKRALNIIADVSTPFLDLPNSTFRSEKVKRKNIDSSKVEDLLARQKEKDENIARLKKKREEKRLNRQEEILKDREQRLLDKEAEKKDLLERKQKVREDYIAQKNAEEAARIKDREEFLDKEKQEKSVEPKLSGDIKTIFDDSDLQKRYKNRINTEIGVASKETSKSSIKLKPGTTQSQLGIPTNEIKPGVITKKGIITDVKKIKFKNPDGSITNRTTFKISPIDNPEVETTVDTDLMSDIKMQQAQARLRKIPGSGKKQ